MKVNQQSWFSYGVKPSSSLRSYLPQKIESFLSEEVQSYSSQKLPFTTILNQLRFQAKMLTRRKTMLNVNRLKGKLCCENIVMKSQIRLPAKQLKWPIKVQIKVSLALSKRFRQLRSKPTIAIEVEGSQLHFKYSRLVIEGNCIIRTELQLTSRQSLYEVFLKQWKQRVTKIQTARVVVNNRKQWARLLSFISFIMKRQAATETRSLSTQNLSKYIHSTETPTASMSERISMTLMIFITEILKNEILERKSNYVVATEMLMMPMIMLKMLDSQLSDQLLKQTIAPTIIWSTKIAKIGLVLSQTDSFPQEQSTAQAELKKSRPQLNMIRIRQPHSNLFSLYQKSQQKQYDMVWIVSLLSLFFNQIMAWPCYYRFEQLCLIVRLSVSPLFSILDIETDS